jgi:hypothetical protein
MRNGDLRAGGVRRVFVFDYREHEWDDGEADDEAFAERFLQMTLRQDWVENEAAGSGDLGYYIAPGVTTAEALRAHCEGVLADYEYPEGTLDAPFAKLAAKVEAEGWRFVGGKFQEFEANHTDTKIFAVLEMRPSGEQACAET